MMKAHGCFVWGWLGALAALWHGLAGLAAAAPTASTRWQLVPVPGTTNFTGTGWYRAWVKVPDSYFSQHERNLFEESVGVYIRDLAGAHEAWVDGEKIGEGGAFPPDYRSGREAMHR